MKTQLVNAARAQEEEFQQKMAQIQGANEDNVRKLNDEKENLRAGLEKRMQQALQALQTNKDEEIEKLQERIEALENHLENICQQHKENMIRAESEKQQALLMGRQMNYSFSKD